MALESDHNKQINLSTTKCACANFVDFATQRNGRRGREKDLYMNAVQ
jgi:hypothetical protein